MLPNEGTTSNSRLKWAALILLGILAFASRLPAPPNHPFRLFLAGGLGTSAMEGYEGRVSEESEAKPVPARVKLQRLEREVVRLRNELKKLQSENDQLKSWPDYGASVLANDDS